MSTVPPPPPQKQPPSLDDLQRELRRAQNTVNNCIQLIEDACRNEKNMNQALSAQIANQNKQIETLRAENEKLKPKESGKK